MKKTRSASPSPESKSTGVASRAKATVGCSTAVVRQWGMAKPPGIPVAELSSRAQAPSKRAWASLERPAAVICSAMAAMTCRGVSAFSVSRLTRSSVMMVMMRCPLSLG